MAVDALAMQRARASKAKVSAVSLSLVRKDVFYLWRLSVEKF